MFLEEGWTANCSSGKTRSASKNFSEATERYAGTVWDRGCVSRNTRPRVVTRKDDEDDRPDESSVKTSSSKVNE